MIHVIFATSNEIQHLIYFIEEICPNSSGYFQWVYFLIETILRTNYMFCVSSCSIQ